MTLKYTIRPYCPDDREAIFRIAGDTAYFGEPIEAYMEDRRLFTDAFYTFYTDYEPEHAWVAVAEDQVVGFLVGCTNLHRYRRVIRLEILPKVIARLWRGYYQIGPKTRRYLWEVFKAFIKGELPGADETVYPAHFHINIASQWRGFGIGKTLIVTYLQQLIESGVPGVYLQTTSQNKAACHLYESMGFRLLGSKRTQMWRWLIQEDIENRCYGRRL